MSAVFKHTPVLSFAPREAMRLTCARSRFEGQSITTTITTMQFPGKLPSSFGDSHRSSLNVSGLPQDDPEEFRAFLKTIGSNVLLKGQMLRPEAVQGWRVLLQGPRFRNWQNDGV